MRGFKVYGDETHFYPYSWTSMMSLVNGLTYSSKGVPKLFAFLHELPDLKYIKYDA